MRKILDGEEDRGVTPNYEAVWIERFDTGEGLGPLVAIKDLIDVVGSVTTAGCRAVADRGQVAVADAPCVAAIRAGGGRLAGKTNLHELAYGVSGVNPWYGTPENPADPGRVPGGSSSGSAVAVAIGEADLAVGSDTGGSVRVPAGSCAVVGLKTTHGLISLDGVWPLAPSFDTIGPLAATVSGVVAAMRLMLGDFEPAARSDAPARVARLRWSADMDIDPAIDAAVDEALRAAELFGTELGIDGWLQALHDHQLLVGAEALESDGWLVAETGGGGIGGDTLARLEASAVGAAEAEQARRRSERWISYFAEIVERHGVVALPTLPYRPPEIGESTRGFNVLTAPINVTGMPAISVPVPMMSANRPPTGLQLVASRGREDLLVTLAAEIEAAVCS